MRSAIATIEALNYYAKKLQRLRGDRAHGVAPHKPILLLSVIELIAKEEISDHRIYLSSQLIQTFLKYWSYLGSENHNPDISRPFFHMKSGKFWHLMASPGYEKVISSGIKLKTFAEVKQAIAYAYLDEDLFDFFQTKSYRGSLKAVLVSRWFPGRLEEINKISDSEKINRNGESLLGQWGKYIQTHQFSESELTASNLR